ncbi:hypothetical protein FS749_016374 [Ceratobasidium sp. UAMH 11750]|nr:hypothetical protein FS749_016374 [Ceratobasidium sp. UAMH 11750]
MHSSLTRNPSSPPTSRNATPTPGSNISFNADVDSGEAPPGPPPIALYCRVLPDVAPVASSKQCNVSDGSDATTLPRDNDNIEPVVTTAEILGPTPTRHRSSCPSCCVQLPGASHFPSHFSLLAPSPDLAPALTRAILSHPRLSRLRRDPTFAQWRLPQVCPPPNPLAPAHLSTLTPAHPRLYLLAHTHTCSLVCLAHSPGLRLLARGITARRVSLAPPLTP